jgi:hypothetical protein
MELSILIARIIGIVYLSFGLGLIFSNRYYKREVIHLYDNASYILFIGILASVIGSLIISYHNIWECNWSVLVTIYGWLALIEGILILIFPRFISWIKPMLKPKFIDWVITPIAVLIGLVFIYFGFVYS